MRDKPGLLPELIIPIAAVAFAIYYMSTVISLPSEAKAFGVALTAGIIVLTVVLFIRFRGEIKQGKKSLSFGGFFSSAEFEIKRYLVMGLTIAFIFIMPFIGFTIALFLFIFLNILILGGLPRLRLALVTATVLTVIGFAVFILAVKVRFPLTVVDRTLLAWIHQL